MWILLVVVLSILSHVIHVEGFGSGAPAARCGDMLPSHGIPAQTSAIPYTFTSPVSTYSPGGQVTLTLGGGSFNGYLIIATDAAGQYVGSMNAPAGATTVGCGGIMNSGLTHSSKVTKNNVIFQWDAPATDRGDISFFVTVVQSYTDYWVRRSLLTLSPEATVPVTPSLPLPQTSFVSPQLTTGVTSLTTTQLTTQGLTPKSDAVTNYPIDEIFYNNGFKLSSPSKTTIETPLRPLGTLDTQTFSTIRTILNDPRSTIKTKHTLPSTLGTYTHSYTTTTDPNSFHTDPPLYYNHKYPVHTPFDRLQGIYPKSLVSNKQYEDPSSSFDHSTTDKYSPTYPPVGFLAGQRALQYDYPSPTATNSPLNFDYDNNTGFGKKLIIQENLNNKKDPQTYLSKNVIYPELSWKTLKAHTLSPSRVTNELSSISNSISSLKEVTSTNPLYIRSSVSEYASSTQNDYTTDQDTSAREATSIATDSKTLERSTIGTTTTSSEISSAQTVASSTTLVFSTQTTLGTHSYKKYIPEGVGDQTVSSPPSSNLTDVTTSSTKQSTSSTKSKKISEFPLEPIDHASGAIKPELQSEINNNLSNNKNNQVSSEAEYTSDTLASVNKNTKDDNGSDSNENNPISNIGVEKELRIRPWGISHIITHGHNLVKASSPKASVQTTTTSKDVKRTTPAQDATPRKLSVQGGNILYDDDCGSSKGCFVKCSDQQCEFMVTWRDVGSGVQFELYGRPGFPNAWIAVGFSDDTKMGGDSVVECVSNNGMVQAFNSENTGYSNRRMNPAQMGLSSMYGTYSNGILYCTFVRQKFMPSMPSMHDLESDWNIMFALGETFNVPAWTIRMHDTSVLPPVSASKVDFQSFDVIGSGVTYKLVKAHGCLMILAWVLFTGIGLVVARYYKNVWADKTFLKLKIWFQVHRACMVVAVLLNVIAFVIIFIDVEGYSEINVPGKSYLKSHPVLGIIVTGLCLANPIMAFFRPGPDSKKRPIFNWAHRGVGMTAYILSAICICFGFQLGKSSTPDYAIYIMIVYILHIIIFDIVFEVLDCMLKRQKKAKVENVEMSTQNGTDTPIPNGHYQTKQSRKSEDRLKTALLLLHLAFTGAFALVLVLVVALN